MIEEEKGSEKKSERDSPSSLPKMAMKSGPDQRKTTSQKLSKSLEPGLMWNACVEGGRLTNHNTDPYKLMFRE